MGGNNSSGPEGSVNGLRSNDFEINKQPCLVGLGVWFPLRVREVPGSNPGRDQFLFSWKCFTKESRRRCSISWPCCISFVRSGPKILFVSFNGERDFRLEMWLLRAVQKFTTSNTFNSSWSWLSSLICSMKLQSYILIGGRASGYRWFSKFFCSNRKFTISSFIESSPFLPIRGTILFTVNSSSESVVCIWLLLKIEIPLHFPNSFI